jgi:secreted trypsin-like serine protease
VGKLIRKLIENCIKLCEFLSGPLMIQLPNQRWIIVGIVSWGIRCGDPKHPGIYTRVNKYVEWIVENAEF